MRCDSKIKLKLSFSLLLSLVLILSYGLFTHQPWLLYLDQQSQAIVQPFQQVPAIHFFTFLAWLGGPSHLILIDLILIGFFWGNHQRILAGRFLSLVLGGNLSVWLIKILVQRPRPILQLAPATGYSFPSGHTFNAALLILILFSFFKTRPQRTPHMGKICYGLCVILLSSVIFSRLYLQNHYISDILVSLGLAGLETMLVFAPSLQRSSTKGVL